MGCCIPTDESTWTSTSLCLEAVCPHELACSHASRDERHTQHAQGVHAPVLLHLRGVQEHLQAAQQDAPCAHRRVTSDMRRLWHSAGLSPAGSVNITMARLGNEQCRSAQCSVRHSGSVSPFSTSVGAGRPSPEAEWDRPSARSRMPAVSCMPPVSAAYAAACRRSMLTACAARPASQDQRPPPCKRSLRWSDNCTNACLPQPAAGPVCAACRLQPGAGARRTATWDKQQRTSRASRSASSAKMLSRAWESKGSSSAMDTCSSDVVARFSCGGGRPREWRCQAVKQPQHAVKAPDRCL